MRCPYCHGPLCQVTSGSDDRKGQNGSAVLWRCIVCGSDTRRPKPSRRSYNQGREGAVIYADK
jgi:RNase P subunit RPR2